MDIQGQSPIAVTRPAQVFRIKVCISGSRNLGFGHFRSMCLLTIKMFAMSARWTSTENEQKSDGVMSLDTVTKCQMTSAACFVNFTP